MQPNGCWLAKSPDPRLKGYARWEYGYGGGWVRRLLAHQWAYLIFVGPIPDGYHVDHLCHKPDGSCAGGVTCPHRACCNPAHLEAVLPRVNWARGLNPAARHARQTHCIRGHPFDETNTIVTAEGYRQCRTCNQERRARAAADPVRRDARNLRTAAWKRRRREAQPDYVPGPLTGERHRERHPAERIPRGEAHPGARLTGGDVLAIRTRAAAGETASALARATGISRSQIRRIIAGTNWREAP